MNEHEKEKYRRILEQFKGSKAPPFKIDLELHRRCNSRCLSCSRRSDPNYDSINEYSEKVEMPKEKWLSIVEEAAALGVREWHIAGGGEPMFLPDVTLPVMNSIKRHDMYGIITTNGTLWKAEYIENTVKIGWDSIHFSIDAPDAETNDYLRNLPGYFEQVVKTITLFNKLKEKHRTNKPTMNMNTVLSVKNYKKLPQMVEFARKMNIEYMFVEPLIVYSYLGAQLKLKEPHIKEFPKYLKRAIELAEKYGIANNFSGIDKNLEEDLIKKSSRMDEVVKDDSEKAEEIKGIKNELLKSFLSVPCYKPWWHMTIKCDGRVTSCDVPITGGDNTGNKSLAEVWNGHYFNSLRKKLLSREVPDFCAQCNPSHITQRRRMRLEIIKMLEPSLLKEGI